MFKGLEKVLGEGISQEFEGGMLPIGFISIYAVITHYSIPKT